MDEGELLQRYRAVRLADVSDALDCLGCMDRYIMPQQMRPLWEGIRFAGIAHTVELVPSSRIIPAMSYEQYKQTMGEMTDNCYAFLESVGPDQVIVVDAKGRSAGLFGSQVALTLMERGVVGMVIDGACRDSCEIRMEGAPVFATVRTCAHVIGRLRFGSDNEPISCAGVPVEPGDIVMGDDDGVLVVPRYLADQAVEIAEDILGIDKRTRRRQYEALGLELDESVT